MAPAEVLLPAGAIAFYLYDSVVPLHDDERVIVHDGRRWTLASLPGFVLLRRRIHLPNPLLPHRAAFTVLLRAAPAGSVPALDDPAPFLDALRPLRACVLLLLGLLVALPVISFQAGAGLAMLAVIAAFYVVLLSAVALLALRRTRLGFSGRDVAAIAADVLLCPPFGINLVRKLARRRGLRGDALAFARRHLDATAVATLEAVAVPDATGVTGAAGGAPR